MLALLASIALADCPSDPPRIHPPWVHVERTSGGDVIARGRLRGGERHGTWCHWAPYGRLVEVTTWHRGVREGVHRTWGTYEASVEGAFRAGERHGPWIELGALGRPVRQGTYDHGKPVGPWVEYDAEGIYVDGLREGLWTFSNREEHYAAGELHGVRRRFDESGTEIRRETFVHGAIDGPVRFVEDGVITTGVLEGEVRQAEWVVVDARGEKERGHYRDGLKTGTWRERIAGGSVVSTWRRGVKHGPYRSEGTGGATTEGAYADDAMSGLWVYVDARGERRELTYRGGRLHGLFRVTRPDGTVSQEGAFIDGARQGPWTEVTAEGTWEGDYVRGAKQGTWTLEREGERLAEEGWSNDRRHGVERRWFADVLVKDCAWADGKEDGLCRTWSFDGTPQQSYTWVAGVLDGPFETWFEDGTPAQRGAYRQGSVDGPYRAWHADGTRAARGAYVAGDPVGLWSWWHASGAVERRGTFDAEGREEGVWTERFPSGALASRGAYTAGVKTGPWTLGYASGQTRLEGTYVDGERSSVWRGWHPNGARAKEGRYVAGFRNGRWTYYRPSGGVARVVDFANGVVVSVDDAGVWFGSEPDPMPDPEERSPPNPLDPAVPGSDPFGPFWPGPGDTPGLKSG